MIEKKIRLATHEEVEEKFKDIDDMTGATDSADGTHGFVPAPKAGDEKKALLGDGTWGIVDAIYSYKTEEEYNQAVANDEIPDGAKVIKEWDDNNELSGILVDSVMSDESVNPVQNKVAKKYMDDISLEISKLNSEFENLFIENGGAGLHNSIYRGKNLGSSFTDVQKAQVHAGTFHDMWIGDYWEIGGVKYRIAHFDYWLNCGYAQCTQHHVVIVPDSCLYSAQMNDTNITTGAYVGSKMYTENLAQAKEIINNAFGSSNILNHRELLANATKATADPTYESDGSWYDSTVDLMNECMVYGSNIFHNVEANGEIPYSYTTDKSQLALFRLDPSKICNRAGWWLRDVVSAAYFAVVANYGSVNCLDASGTRGVRPAFGITA